MKVITHFAGKLGGRSKARLSAPPMTNASQKQIYISRWSGSEKARRNRGQDLAAGISDAAWLIKYTTMSLREHPEKHFGTTRW